MPPLPRTVPPKRRAQGKSPDAWAPCNRSPQDVVASASGHATPGGRGSQRGNDDCDASGGAAVSRCGAIRHGIRGNRDNRQPALSRTGVLGWRRPGEAHVRIGDPVAATGPGRRRRRCRPAYALIPARSCTTPRTSNCAPAGPDPVQHGLVNEVWLKLARSQPDVRDREHCLALRARRADQARHPGTRASLPIQPSALDPRAPRHRFHVLTPFSPGYWNRCARSPPSSP